MSLDGAERRIKALQRLVRAQELGLMTSPLIITTDAAGATPEGAERILEREMAERGLETSDLKEAGVDVIHVNMPWAAGRNLRFGDKAAGLCDESGRDILGARTHYDPSERASDTQSVGLNPQNTDGTRRPGDSPDEDDDLAPHLTPE